MKIKSRKELKKEYKLNYGNISDDVYERLKNHLGDKFDEKLIQMANRRIDEVKDNIEYYKLQFTFYEEPTYTHRPRKGYFGNMYVPNADANKEDIKEFVKNIKEDISIICTPMKINLKAYYPMPKQANPLEVLLYETEHDYAIGKPDFDNVLKAYCDMIQSIIIMDDDIVSSSSFNKFFSLKPRVELEIVYTNGFASEYAYKTISKRKTFSDLKIEASLLVEPYKNLKKKVKG